MILGIAGKACSGKNAVAALLEKQGYRSIDVDTLGHAALEEKKYQVAEKFGKNLLTSENHIDRKQLGVIVFKDRVKLKELEMILHPVIFQMVKNLVKGISHEKLVINAAILGKTGMDTLCDKVLWIETPLLKRIKRAIIRDNKKLSLIFSRIRSQHNLTVQHFSAGVDIYMVRNKGSFSDLEKQIELFLLTPEKYKRV